MKVTCSLALLKPLICHPFPSASFLTVQKLIIYNIIGNWKVSDIIGKLISFLQISPALFFIYLFIFGVLVSAL